jgi:hypothetical protein
MNQKQVKTTKPFLLWWYDQKANKNLPAGVAFYDEQFAEYRLKLDMHPDTQYYLKPTGAQGESVHYRAEVVIKKDGKFHQRKVIGEGQSSKETNGDIFVEFGPYSKLLVLGVKDSD